MPRPDLGEVLRLNRSRYTGPLIMGVINVTPDSFSGEPDDTDPEKAYEKALKFLEEGADILDIGAESTRPGFTPTPPEEERRRLLPVLERLATLSTILSIDTRSPDLFRETIHYGASLINDVGMLRHPGFITLLKDHPSLMAILMHSPETPSLHTPVQAEPEQSVEDVVRSDFLVRISDLARQGISENRLVLDPGLGFGKDTKMNLALLRTIERWGEGFPVLVGASRKRFIGEIAGSKTPFDREAGTLAVQNWCHLFRVSIIRTHNVSQARQARAVFQALLSDN
ncbi:dihydropteroate synthase [Leptospirillum ferriphilum]|uniref:dihydropteroate synthase n=1 Tax=Leptospirillum ferriphilum TaxID=178606 RepID=UPI0006B1B4F4|nr:dihydropteroate synthase [Leptospirillum ferriphilum]